MEVDPVVVAPSGIAALPSTTVRQIGSQQIIIDPSSVAKELIDNALDARANSICVDIMTNTIGSIQVKDDGHGVPAEDRALLCRRYCTSKIRSFHDLKDLGGKWLGFRGEALASIAAISGALLVTTRVEGESVAVQMEYGRNGELSSTTRASHPVGTTVKVTNIFEPTPVRVQYSLNNSTKCLVKLRRLIQAYALARPTVRFRLHVLKAKNNKGDLIYAPKANANVEDAVLKIIGKDCGIQCDWIALEMEDFEIHALLPKSTANGAKVANHGAFISVDSRPMSTRRGIPKKIVTAFKGRLCKANPSFGTVRDPFFCMNIICPPGSYDPNLEPAKDNVIFDDEDLVMSAVDKLFTSFYSEVVVESEVIEPPASAQQSQEMQIKERPAPSTTPFSIYENVIGETNEPSSYQQGDLPRWRSSMYGIDEDDLEFLPEEQLPVVDEEEGRRAKDVSNPWTIARMNAATKPRKVIGSGQLLSPAKSPGAMTLESSSSATAVTPRRTPSVEPLTPQTFSRKNIPRSSLDEELERSIQRLPQLSSEQRLMRSRGRTAREQEQPRIPPAETSVSVNTIQDISQRSNVLISESNHHSSASARSLHNSSNAPVVPASTSSAPRRRPRKQKLHKRMAPTSPEQESSDMWFGQPMRGPESSSPSYHPKQLEHQGMLLFPRDNTSVSRRSVPPAADQPVENNSDIRKFFRQNLGQQSSPWRNFQRLSFSGSSKVTSAEQQARSEYTRDQLLVRSNHDESPEPQDIAEQLRAYVEREAPLSEKTLLRETWLEPNQCSNDDRNSLRVNEDIEIGPEPHSSSNSLKTPLSHEVTSTTQPNKQVPSTNPRISPSHPTTKSRPARHQTTDAAQRTKSSKLPLERTPPGQRIQNIVFPVTTSMLSIRQSSLELDMRYNSLEWGYGTDDGFHVFAEPVNERRMMAWAVRIDDLVGEIHERMDGVEVIRALHKGIQRGFDATKQITRDEHMRTLHPARGTETEHRAKDPVRSDDNPIPSVSVDADAGMNVGSTLNHSEHLPDEMNDDMLMDL